MKRKKSVSKPKLFIEELERPATAGTLTTLIVGEEATKCSGDVTTFAVGEEGIKNC